MEKRQKYNFYPDRKLNRDTIEKLERLSGEPIRLAKLAGLLNVQIKNLKELFEKSGVHFEKNPMYKVPGRDLKKIVNGIFGKNIASIEKDDLIEKTEQIQKSNSEPYIKKNPIEVESISEITNESKSDSLIIPTNLNELKEKIKQIDQGDYIKSVVLQQFIRNEYVKEYARIRANGICELCEQKAPFNDINNNPFLEVHHIIWLSKGGKDSIENVACLCPNCHRKIHNLNSETDLQKLLNKRTLC